jgi:hypothetical protein
LGDTAMNVYQWGSDLESRWLTTSTESDIERLLFDGTSRIEGWAAPKVQWIIENSRDAERSITDCPNLTPGVPALSAQAVLALKQLLAEAGELLPLDHGSHKYFALNVTKVLSALDETRSTIIRFPSSAQIMTVKTFAFFEEILSGSAVFKESELARSAVFCTDAFVQAVAAANLSGFKFKRVWSSGAQPSLPSDVPASAALPLRPGRA